MFREETGKLSRKVGIRRIANLGLRTKGGDLDVQEC